MHLVTGALSLCGNFIPVLSINRLVALAEKLFHNQIFDGIASMVKGCNAAFGCNTQCAAHCPRKTSRTNRKRLLNFLRLLLLSPIKRSQTKCISIILTTNPHVKYVCYLQDLEGISGVRIHISTFSCNLRSEKCAYVAECHRALSAHSVATSHRAVR
jgi:hypothetical protein